MCAAVPTPEPPTPTEEPPQCPACPGKYQHNIIIPTLYGNLEYRKTLAYMAALSLVGG